MKLEPRPPLKKMWFFWSNSYKTEVVITSLIEMLELPNFGHMIASTIWLDSPKKILLVTSWTEVMMSLWCQNVFILRRPRVAIFAEIIKIVTMFIKQIFKDSRKKVIRIRNYVSKRKLCLYFLICQNFVIFGEKMLMSAELKGCVTWFIYFLDFL